MLKSLNDVSPQDLVEIETLASYFFTPKEIAIMLQMQVSSMLEGIDDEESEVHKAFQSGRLQSEMELRKSIIKLSKSGSSPAQTMALDLLNKSRVKMMDR